MSIGKKTNTPVLQDWVIKLSWKEQTGLISAVRGLDLPEDSDYYKESKTITKMLRYLILNNADSKTSFMELDVVYLETDVSDVLHTISNLGSMYKHWYDHIIMAINIIANKHDNPYVRHYYKGVKDCLEFLVLDKDDNINSDASGTKDIITLDDLKPSELDDDEYIRPEITSVDEDPLTPEEISTTLKDSNSSELLISRVLVNVNDINYVHVSNYNLSTVEETILNGLGCLDAVFLREIELISNTMSVTYPYALRFDKNQIDDISIVVSLRDVFVYESDTRNIHYVDSDGDLYMIYPDKKSYSKSVTNLLTIHTIHYDKLDPSIKTLETMFLSPGNKLVELKICRGDRNE